MKFASSTNVDVKKNIFIFILLSFILFFLDRSDSKYLKNIRYIINDTIIYSSVIIKSPFSFILDKSNELAFFSAQRVGQEFNVDYNPFFIHGNVGIGKTHLLNAIAWKIKNEYKTLT